MPEYVVKLESNPDVWIAQWAGSPGRTNVLATARRYATKGGALIGLGMARMRGRKFPDAMVEEVQDAR